MADVIFEEDQDTIRRPAPQTKATSSTTGPMGYVYKMGLAKSKTGANLVLVGTIIFCILLSVGVLILSGVIQFH